MTCLLGAGINHKEYGVTSEGINVYLDVALRNILDIDPRKKPFTIKITGGPDGDVSVFLCFYIKSVDEILILCNNIFFYNR